MTTIDPTPSTNTNKTAYKNLSLMTVTLPDTVDSSILVSNIQAIFDQIYKSVQDTELSDAFEKIENIRYLK